MDKGRIEAFSDGVIAIIITIMVLELKVPHGADPGTLLSLAPLFLSYVLSFVFIGIYWTNHHHLFQLCSQVNGRVLWANLHLLFWLSLIPFVTGWMGENEFSILPVAVYGVILWLAGFGYTVLVRSLISLHGRDSALATAIGRDRKGLLTLLLLSAAIPLALISPWLAIILYVVVAVMWFIPDQRIEKAITP